MKPILITLFSIFTICASAQKDTIQIKTTAQCEMCKTTIEKGLYSSKGIKMVNLDLETNILTVIFKTKKIDENQIRNTISSIGYDADDLKANKKVHNELPFCCQNPNSFKKEE